MIRALLTRLHDRLAPLGYEDPDGFHQGAEPYLADAALIDFPGIGVIPDPYIAEQVRAALNQCEGYPLDLGDIPHIPSGAHLPRTGPGDAQSPHDRVSGLPHLNSPSHASGDTA